MADEMADLRGRFFISKNWTCFWGYQSFCPIPWDFEIFAQFLKLRGRHPYAWVFRSVDFYAIYI